MCLFNSFPHRRLEHYFLIEMKVCAVVGFPLGAMATAVKVAETLYCHEKGANEIDMVINIGYLKSREFDIVRNDILRVVEVCHQRNMMCKVILEVCLLEEEEKAIAATIAVECGADYIKTSTGFSNGGAVLNDIRLMASIAHEKGAFVKASGGIRDGYFATSLIEAGADRLGTSATVKVYEECLNIIHKAHEAAIAQQAHLS